MFEHVITCKPKPVGVPTGEEVSGWVLETWLVGSAHRGGSGFGFVAFFFFFCTFQGHPVRVLGSSMAWHGLCGLGAAVHISPEPLSLVVGRGRCPFRWAGTSGRGPVGLAGPRHLARSWGHLCRSTFQLERLRPDVCVLSSISFRPVFWRTPARTGGVLSHC